MPSPRDRRSPRLLALLLVLPLLVVVNIVRLMGALPSPQQIDQDEPLQLHSNATLAYGIDKAPMQPGRQSRLADGCYHVFLDVGSNIGVHARFLYEPSLYPKAWIARKFFTAHFGPEILRDNRDFCVFGFEPNPTHVKRHREMEDAYSKMGWRYHSIPAGVGDENGNMTFYSVADDLGYTAIPKKGCVENNCTRQEVPVVRLSEWIEREVHGRRIPPIAFGGRGFVAGPRVVMKLDIEMLEWLVLPDLIRSGVLCRDIDGAIGEFHLQWFLYPVSFPERNLTLDNATQAEAYRDKILEKIWVDRKCKTRMEMRDDESHAEDGMPWPKPPI